MSCNQQFCANNIWFLSELCYDFVLIKDLKPLAVYLVHSKYGFYIVEVVSLKTAVTWCKFGAQILHTIL